MKKIIVRFLEVTQACVVVACLAGAACAASLQFTISVDRNRISLGDAVYLNLIFEGVHDVPAPSLPAIAGFNSQYVGPSTNISIVNGRTSSSITYMYLLSPLKTGNFTVGPFTIDYQGSAYTSNQAVIEVVNAQPGSIPSQGTNPNDGAVENTDVGNKISLALQPEKTRVYINETFGVKIKLYINNINLRNAQYPEMNHEGFSFSDYGRANQYQESVGGVEYNVVEFDTTAFATKTGELTLGPAALRAEMLVKKQRQRRPAAPDGFGGLFDDNFFDNFFNGYTARAVTFTSAQIPVTVLPLPQEDKPADFNGAVGVFDFEAEASPREVAVGDPVTLRLIIKGKGNFNTVQTPFVHLAPDDFKSYEPQVSFKDNSKVFEYVVMPQSERITAIPKVTFSFFDTDQGKYRTLEQGPFEIKVKKQKQNSEQRIVEGTPTQTMVSQKLGRDIVYIKDSLGKISAADDMAQKNYLWFILQVIPLLVFLVFWRVSFFAERLKNDQRYAASLKAPKVARSGVKDAQRFLKDSRQKEFYETIFKTMQKYLGYKLHTPWQGITSGIVGAIKEKGIEEEVIKKISLLFSECDMVRYAPAEFDIQKMQASLENLQEVLNHLEKRL